MPPSGSCSCSVFLNLYHLVNCCKKNSQSQEAGQVFPWILLHIWKARNGFCFEHIRLDPTVVLDKALVEAEIWRELHDTVRPNAPQAALVHGAREWKKPPMGWGKCNFASSWANSSSRCGGAWIVRDGFGKVIFHSWRSFTCLSNPLEAELSSLLWTVEDMVNLRVDKVIFESSSIYLKEAFLQNSIADASPIVSLITQRLHGFSEWCTELVFEESNMVAVFIAESVTRDQRSQSYVGTGGPS
ncbi:hypothetical protein F2Q69_00054834 [Brassica cretica]|uniref:RNase H type-1 domain-containing protein n=1 Tax=Brassica cretica TaxID=69181 RepID=A0A8S9N3G0_BRACR|nr:hypothetical protein F2Q69_00054834 [Brassica cretica]